ncbi:glutathione S-transferase family protein [Celeribacter sp.]|uniref:glutathione S-transferase family protein n=1 Tax=Celeribacter sp. TaxID=1890673 RepID=UPI003A92F98B
MRNITLYSYPGACSRVTMCALEEAGLAYDTCWIDVTSQEQHSKEYLALNRKAKVPALVVGGQTLTENAAILQYIHQISPDAGLLPTTGSALLDAQLVSDLMWCGGTLHPMVRQIRAPQKWTVEADAASGICADGMAKLAYESAYIDARIATSKWWYGDKWSIVDVYLYWVTSTAGRSGFSLSAFPAIREHAARVRERPSFQRTVAHEALAAKRAGIPVDPSSF